MKVSVITPTIGSEHLRQCVESVRNQTYKNVDHYFFVDGKEAYSPVEGILFDKRENEYCVWLDKNIGKGWYGHKVYASCFYFISDPDPSDIVIYLDEDNWLKPDHIETMVSILKHDSVDWCYSLRSIHDKDGKFVCDDNCESLGLWPAALGDNIYHIDTSCYAVKAKVAYRAGPSWYGQWGADRQFFENLRRCFPSYECTGKHTVCYRLEGNSGSVSKEFFITGNNIHLYKYGNNFPWKNINT